MTRRETRSIARSMPPSVTRSAADPAPRPRRVGGRRREVADPTTEPDPGPAPEAVFDWVTGPYTRRAALALPGAAAPEDA
jgi:hypothetical protein